MNGRDIRKVCLGMGSEEKHAPKVAAKTRGELLDRILDLVPYRGLLFSLFVVLSILFHLVLMTSITVTAKRDKKKATAQETPVTLKLEPPVEIPAIKEPAPLPEKRPPEKRKKTAERTETSKPQIKALPANQLEAIGERHMAMVEEGAFPSLILNYHDPNSYIKEMYTLGAKTVLLDAGRQSYSEIDLFTGEIIPMTPKDFNNFSPMKRVIKDFEWIEQKRRAALRLSCNPENLQILLLVPLHIENRWTGHQVSVFNQLHTRLSDVTSVEALIRKASFKVIRIYLKDGTVKEVQDPGAA